MDSEFVKPGWHSDLSSRKKNEKVLKYKLNMTDVIYDPLGQTHSPTSSDNCFHLTFCKGAWNKGYYF